MRTWRQRSRNGSPIYTPDLRTFAISAWRRLMTNRFDCARDEGYLIVTKDDDFRQRSFLRGAPPKVLWTKLGNCSAADVERALRGRYDEIIAFADDEMAALLVVERP